MSLFDYPRINFKGTIAFNPGTANNDDYAASAALPASWGPFAGKPLGLIDSKNVAARTYGMSDDNFISWVQNIQTFDNVPPPGTSPIIPAEWNYYGDMNNSFNAKVIGVQKAANKIFSKPLKSDSASAVIGATLNFTGHFTDVNSQGSPPATQFFVDQVKLKKGNKTLISGAASKAPGLWLNFYRNVNLAGDAGAGAYAYHVIKKSDKGTVINIPGFQDPKIVGVIFRYYLSRAMGVAGQTKEDIVNLYKSTGNRSNPKELEIVGTFAPLYADEKFYSMPTGRLMVSNVSNISTPPSTKNNGANGLIALAPAVLKRNGNTISADFSGTFPDYYNKTNKTNPKYNFGPVNLQVTNGKDTATIGAVDYADTAKGDNRGWIFDFDISSNKSALNILKSRNASFKLVHGLHETVLEETEYYFVTNQLVIYAEQHGSGSEFRNQGTIEPATVSVFRRGVELKGRSCPPVAVWQYRSIPLEAPGNAVPINSNYKPGQPLEIDTSQPGNFLFTFSINTLANPAPAGYPPASYTTFMNPPYVTNWPSISLRILPNTEDFSQYYVDPSSSEPVGNDRLTFDIVYRKVLRTYYLLYPIMNQHIPLNNEAKVAAAAASILGRTDPDSPNYPWMSNGFMPKTRDMSESRRTLLRAWCRKVLATQKKKKGAKPKMMRPMS